MIRARTLIEFCLLLLVVQSASCGGMLSSQKKDTVCKTKECEARGKEYKNNMDAKANPCQDFYTFACGNFPKNHPGPKYNSEYNVINVMNDEMVSIIRETLESYKFPPNENSLFRQAKEVYETCLKIPEYPIKEAKEIAREITKIRSVPNTPIWDIHTKYLQLSGESAFFRTKVLGNRPSEGIPVLMLMEPYSAYGSIYHEPAWKPQEKEAYTNFLFLLIKSLKFKESDAVIRDRIHKVFEFRRHLDLIIDRNSKKRPDVFNPLTGRELDMWFISNLGMQTKTQDIPWPEVLNVLFHSLPWQVRLSRNVIAMRQSEYFIELMNLLKDASEEVLALHMEIYFVERQMKLNDDMIKLLEETSVEPHALFSYIRQNKFYARWQICIENHNMQETLEEMLFDKLFEEDQQKTVHQIIKKLKVAMENQMKASKWLNQETRVNTMRKLNELEEWIGFPASFTKDFVILKERKKTDILTPNASFNMKEKLLYVHLPILLSPIFGPTLPVIYNYAGIGATIGHELYQVVQECGSYSDNGKIVTWWTQEMKDECLKRKRLFINAYNQITNREFKNRYNIEVESDTSISFSQNFADVMGLEAAYNAYTQLLSNDQSVCQLLPGLKDYNCDQMFYIAFANAYCGRYTGKSALEKLYKWKHSIDSVRINGAVAQMESFGSAFNCPVGTPMNPKEKVNLWK